MEVGDLVQVVSGKYSGQLGEVKKFTPKQVTVELAEGFQVSLAFKAVALQLTRKRSDVEAGHTPTTPPTHTILDTQQLDTLQGEIVITEPALANQHSKSEDSSDGVARQQQQVFESGLANAQSKRKRDDSSDGDAVPDDKQAQKRRLEQSGNDSSTLSVGSSGSSSSSGSSRAQWFDSYVEQSVVEQTVSGGCSKWMCYPPYYHPARAERDNMAAASQSGEEYHSFDFVLDPFQRLSIGNCFSPQSPHPCFNLLSLLYF